MWQGKAKPHASLRRKTAHRKPKALQQGNDAQAPVAEGEAPNAAQPHFAQEQALNAALPHVAKGTALAATASKKAEQAVRVKAVGAAVAGTIAASQSNHSHDTAVRPVYQVSVFAGIASQAEQVPNHGHTYSTNTNTVDQDNSNVLNVSPGIRTMQQQSSTTTNGSMQNRQHVASSHGSAASHVQQPSPPAATSSAEALQSADGRAAGPSSLQPLQKAQHTSATAAAAPKQRLHASRRRAAQPHWSQKPQPHAAAAQSSGSAATAALHDSASEHAPRAKRERKRSAKGAALDELSDHGHQDSSSCFIKKQRCSR